MKAHKRKGLIFDIQRYCLHDGPGIRTVVFFKGCPLRCRWCSNPESLKKNREVAYKQNDCIACYHCISACDENAIQKRQNGIIINREKCKNSFSCVNVCPSGALSIFGEWYTSDEVLDIALKDIAFYRNSDGGLTLSGGEVLMQSAFAAELLEKAKKHNIHTAIETSGYADWAFVKNVIEYTDLILFDIKIADSKKHYEYTGVYNERILDNLKKIIDTGKQVIARIPLIPTVNMDNKSVESFIQLIQDYNIEEVNILPFHQLGESKYDLLGIDYRFKNIKPSSDENIKAIADRMKDEGISVKIGG